MASSMRRDFFSTRVARPPVQQLPAMMAPVARPAAGAGIMAAAAACSVSRGQTGQLHAAKTHLSCCKPKGVEFLLET